MADFSANDSWNPLKQPVNKFLLSGVWSPGICRQPTGAAIVRNLDERVGYGVDFAFLVFTGRKLASFTTTLDLYTQKDWDDWQHFRRVLIHRPPSRGPVSSTTEGYLPGKALVIWHPQLYPLDITQCVVESEPQEDIEDSMVAHVTIGFRQVKVKPQSMIVRPEAAEADQPKTADEVELERATEELNSARERDRASGAW
jgi:hypothetical protein